MRKLRASWLALAALAGALAASPALAQSDSETLADFRACAEIERDGARLACFDGVATRANPEAAARAANTPREPASAPAAEPAGAAASDPVSAPADEAANTRAPEPARETSNDTRQAPAAEPAPAASNEPSAAPAGGTRTIRIVELRERRPGEFVFYADNGQVWEQTSGGRGRYPPAPFDAVLESGALSSTFLVSPLGGPSVRVVLRD